MNKNENGTDRVIRVVLGLILGVLAYERVGGAIGTWGFGIFGVLALVTGITGFCGVYRLLGIRTCPLPPSKSR